MSLIINNITQFFRAFFSPEITVVIVSMLPFIELRGAIPIGVAMGLPLKTAIIISLIGSTIPAILIVYLIGYVFVILRNIQFMDKLITKINIKTLSKREQIEKFGYIGLILFVGIPLPGTGAWSGSLLAHLLNLDKKKSILAITLGNIIAAIIISTLSYGLFKFIR